MKTPTLVPPLLGKIIGSMADGFIVAEWQEEEREPGAPFYIAPYHLHRKDDEAWYVLEGTLRFRLGDEEVEARAGSAVFAPRGVPHTFWNPSRDPVRYLIVMTPNTYKLIQEIHALTDRSREALKALFNKYDCELLEG
jgi:mannose-6-phosphate isomerase-like protein (cupin superfamily)